jgi:hypothetical protein
VQVPLTRQHPAYIIGHEPPQYIVQETSQWVVGVATHENVGMTHAPSIREGLSFSVMTHPTGKPASDEKIPWGLGQVLASYGPPSKKQAKDSSSEKL